jgi:hypothetical protein
MRLVLYIHLPVTREMGNVPITSLSSTKTGGGGGGVTAHKIGNQKKTTRNSSDM